MSNIPVQIMLNSLGKFYKMFIEKQDGTITSLFTISEKHKLILGGNKAFQSIIDSSLFHSKTHLQR